MSEKISKSLALNFLGYLISISSFLCMIPLWSQGALFAFENATTTDPKTFVLNVMLSGVMLLLPIILNSISIFFFTITYCMKPIGSKSSLIGILISVVLIVLELMLAIFTT